MSDGDSTQKLRSKTKYLPYSMSFNILLIFFRGIYWDNRSFVKERIMGTNLNK